MIIFDQQYLNELSILAKNNTRLRQHKNIHQSFSDPCQRLLNAIEPESYIRPHRHVLGNKAEMLMVIRGIIALIIFDDQGTVLNFYYLGTERYGGEFSAGAVIEPNSWHTVVALEPDCVLLEVKAGPFNPEEAKELATWAPEENTEAAQAYLQNLRSILLRDERRFVIKPEIT